MTNRERLTAMTDRERGLWMHNHPNICDTCSHANRHGDIKCDITNNHTSYDCINGYYEWLEQEADNETENNQ